MASSRSGEPERNLNDSLDRLEEEILVATLISEEPRNTQVTGQVGLRGANGTGDCEAAATSAGPAHADILLCIANHFSKFERSLSELIIKQMEPVGRISVEMAKLQQENRPLRASFAGIGAAPVSNFEVHRQDRPAPAQMGSAVEPGNADQCLQSSGDGNSDLRKTVPLRQVEQPPSKVSCRSEASLVPPLPKGKAPQLDDARTAEDVSGDASSRVYPSLAWMSLNDDSDIARRIQRSVERQSRKRTISQSMSKIVPEPESVQSVIGGREDVRRTNISLNIKYPSVRSVVGRQPSDAAFGALASAANFFGFNRAQTVAHSSETTPESQQSKAGKAQAPAIFADVNSMKEKLREAIIKPKYDVTNFYHKIGWCQHIARSYVFEQITLLVIALNAAWIAIDTEYNEADVPTKADLFFQVGENAFCLYFTAEWLIRFLAFKSKSNCLRDAWFVFDSILVFMIVCETWVMFIVFSLVSTDGGGGFSNTSIVRLVRLLRLTRMARMAKLLVALPELNILMKGIAVAFRSVFFTLLLLIVIIYMFGIAFTQLLVETQAGTRYFASVADSMLTLLLHGTLLEDLPRVVHALGRESVFYAGFLLLFVLIASLTVMNMLIGILCEVVTVVSAVEKESCMLNFVKARIQNVLLLSGLDADGNGMIDKEEFEKLIEIPEAARALQDVGVDVLGLVDSADFIFGIDGGTQLSFADFMDLVLQLRGSNTATVKDIVDLRKFFSQELLLTEEKVASRINSRMQSSILPAFGR